MSVDRYDHLRRDARVQAGMFTPKQALAAGFSKDDVYRKRRSNEWCLLLPHVLTPSIGAPRSWKDDLRALMISTGGVASHRSAAALHGLLPPPSTPEVTVERRQRNRRRPGLHSSLWLPTRELVEVDGIVATNPARTIVDVAASMTIPEVTKLVDAAVVRRLVGPPYLERRARELLAPGRPGARRVLEALATQHPDLSRARNEWEGLMLRLSREAGLPDPVPNHRVEVAGRVRYLDTAWPDALVFNEFDGYEWHSGRAKFDDDRERQNDLVDALWLPFRLTSTHLERDEHRAFAPVARAVRRRLAQP